MCLDLATLRSSTAAAAAKSLQSCPTLWDHIDSSPPGSPWDSPGKNTGVGCHFLLQCMKEKSESEVTQSCPTLSDPMDWSLLGSSAHGIFQARVLEWGAIAFSSSYIGVLIWEKFMQFHTYVLCAFLSVSYTSIKKLIKALKKIEYVKYMCYLKFSRNVN